MLWLASCAASLGFKLTCALAAVPTLSRSESISSHPVEVGSRAGSEDSEGSAARSLRASPVTAEPLAAAPSQPASTHSHSGEGCDAEEEATPDSSSVHTPSPEACEEAEEGGNSHRRRGSSTPQRLRERFFPAERPLPEPQPALAQHAQHAEPPGGSRQDRRGSPGARSAYDPSRYQRGEGPESSPGEEWNSPESAEVLQRAAQDDRARLAAATERSDAAGVEPLALCSPPSSAEVAAAMAAHDGGQDGPADAAKKLGLVASAGGGSIEPPTAAEGNDAEEKSPAGLAAGSIRVDVTSGGEVERDARASPDGRESPQGTALKDWGRARTAASLSPSGTARS